MSTTVSADLRVALETEGRRTVTGHLTGEDSRLRLDLDDAGIFAGPDDADTVRALARGLAARGIVVEVYSDGDHLITVGDVRAPWWQRRLTGTRRIRLRSARGAWTSAKSRARRQGAVLPSSSALPPATLWPPFPTFLRSGPRRPASTHDPARGGSPRLVLTKEHVWAGERLPVFWLTGSRTTVGSDPECDVVLPGLRPTHAVITHDERDEFCVTLLGPGSAHGASVEGSTVLRTGARLELGNHVLVFHREEYADHGRPHGGRIGGELGRQRPASPHDGTSRSEWTAR